jgi:hypothetical protein
MRPQAGDITNSASIAGSPSARQSPFQQQHHHSKRPPAWVAAASLASTLAGGGKAVPAMQAAAQRERRLALTAALAAQDVSLGAPCPMFAHGGSRTGGSQRAGSATAAAQPPGEPGAAAPTTFITLHLAAQAAALRRQVERQGEQMRRQEALLRQVLAAGPPEPPGHVAGGACQTAAKVSGGKPAAPAEGSVSPQMAAGAMPEAARNSWLVRSVLGMGDAPAAEPSAVGAAAAQAGVGLAPACPSPALPQPEQPAPAALPQLCEGLASLAGATASGLRQQRKEALKATLRVLLLGSPPAGQRAAAPAPRAGVPLAQLLQALLLGGPAAAASTNAWPRPQRPGMAFPDNGAEGEGEGGCSNGPDGALQVRAAGRSSHNPAEYAGAAARRAAARGAGQAPYVPNARRQEQLWLEELRQCDGAAAKAEPEARPRGCRARPEWDDRPLQPAPPRHQERHGRRTPGFGAPPPLPALPAPPPGRPGRKGVLHSKGSGGPSAKSKRRAASSSSGGGRGSGGCGSVGIERAEAARAAELRVGLQLQEEELLDR